MAATLFASQYGATRLMRRLLMAEAPPQPPGGFYVGLLSSIDLWTCGSAIEISGSGYARAPLTFDASTNHLAVVFPLATGDWGSVPYAAIFDAQTGGNLIAACRLRGPDTDSTPSIMSGSDQFSIFSKELLWTDNWNGTDYFYFDSGYYGEFFKAWFSGNISTYASLSYMPKMGIRPMYATNTSGASPSICAVGSRFEFNRDSGLFIQDPSDELGVINSSHITFPAGAWVASDKIFAGFYFEPFNQYGVWGESSFWNRTDRLSAINAQLTSHFQQSVMPVKLYPGELNVKLGYS